MDILVENVWKCFNFISGISSQDNNYTMFRIDTDKAGECADKNFVWQCTTFRFGTLILRKWKVVGFWHEHGARGMNFFYELCDKTTFYVEFIVNINCVLSLYKDEIDKHTTSTDRDIEKGR